MQIKPVEQEEFAATRSLLMKHWFTRFKLSEGFVLAGITGLGYFAAYLSEISYKGYYGLPSLYADVSLNSVILSITSIVIVMGIFILASAHSTIAKFSKWIIPVLLPLGIAVFMGVKTNFEVHISLRLLVLTFILHVVLTALLMVLISHRQSVLALFIAILLTILISRSSGYILAANQTEYLVTMEPSPLVVVDTYKDSLILMPVDLKNKTIIPEYRFVEQKSENMEEMMKLNKIKIGPLKLIETDDGSEK